MAWVNVDDVLLAASSEQEDRYQRLSPYKVYSGNPFGTAVPCPIPGCSQKFAHPPARRRHIEFDHGEAGPRHYRPEARVRETPEHRAVRLKAASERALEVLHRSREAREQAS